MEECVQVICFNCNGHGHRIKDCTFRDNLTCYRCGKRGHKNSRCGVLLPRDRGTLRKEKKDYNISTKCIVCNMYGHASCMTCKMRKFRSNCFDDLYEEQKTSANKAKANEENDEEESFPVKKVKVQRSEDEMVETV